MVERYDGEQLPPVHPVQGGRLPLPDGQTVPLPPPPPAPVDLPRARLIAFLVAVIVVAAVAYGTLR